MSSLTTSTSLNLPLTPSNRTSTPNQRHSHRSDNTLTPTSTQSRRQRQNSHLASSLFPSISRTGNMAMALSTLPPDYPGEGCKAGEVFMHEWPIYDVKRLQSFVEQEPRGVWGVDGVEDDKETLPEPLRRGIVIGGGWFKLDLARTSPPCLSPLPGKTDPTIDSMEIKDPNNLSLYVAALSLDSNSVDITYPATIFVGIKSLITPIGSRLGETKYHWSIQGEWEFSSLREFWEVELPKLSQLLLYPDIQLHDGFTICVQISTPTSVKPTFQLPGQITVPRNIISGLGGLVDSTTGDVKFVCLEHALRPVEIQGELQHSQQDKAVQSLSRKRVLYAHSEILKASCDYFHDLLTGDFEETDRARRGDSRYTTVLVDDAGFETVYWMLRFIYTNELTFALDDDVRVIMDQLRIDRHEINRMLSAPHLNSSDEWVYRRLYRSGDEIDGSDNFDVRTVKSASSVSTRLSVVSPTPHPRSNTTTSRNSRRSPGPEANAKTDTPLSTPCAKSTRPQQTQPSQTINRPGKPSNPPPKQDRSASNTGNKSSSNGINNRSPYMSRVSDPHAHPCNVPAPASALSIFMLSHRYRLESLERLAKDHILDRLTKENCMPMLLATYQYDGLHSETLDYIIDNWSVIQPTPEFLECIQEVSTGTWGETGGMVLHGLFKRL